MRSAGEGAEILGSLGRLWFFSSYLVFHVEGDFYVQQFTDTKTDFQQRVEKGGNITWHCVNLRYQSKSRNDNCRTGLSREMHNKLIFYF